MCGIAGIYDSSSNASVASESLMLMCNTLSHRGPDGEGFWVSPQKNIGLAHRRLSIIDLSDAASQPMGNEDGSIQVVFNGEIYNHLALRRELMELGHRFKTDHSDTEVLVHGYEAWGDDLWSRLQGMFAVGLFDGNTGDLILVRDRIGIKPLYLSLRGTLFLFASEIKAILAYPGCKRDLDPFALYHYLSFMTPPAPLTLFSNILKLPAGSLLKVSKSGKLTFRRFWDAVSAADCHGHTIGMTENETEAYFVSGIRERLTRAVEKRMMSDVPMGVFLSGGIDSTTNAALMSRVMDRPADTFTVGFKDHQHLNELDYAELAANTFGTRHHTVMIDEQDMIGYLDQLIYHQDEPIADWVCIPLYFVSKLARETGVKVVQVGEGADEQFCGYQGYLDFLRLYNRYWSPFRSFLPQVLQRAVALTGKGVASVYPRYTAIADIIDRASRDREHFWSGATVFWELQKHALVNREQIKEDAHSEYTHYIDCGLLPESYLTADSFHIIDSFRQDFIRESNGNDVLMGMIYNEFRLRLPELLLMRVDKITMSVGLEARVPFLDHELVEFTQAIPMHWKIRGGQSKYLLKKAVRGIIPDAIIDRPKMGFGAPMCQWLRGKFGNVVESAIFASPLIESGYFNKNYIHNLFKNHRTGKIDLSVYIWTLFNLTAWYDYWIEKPSQMGNIR